MTVIITTVIIKSIDNKSKTIKSIYVVMIVTIMIIKTVNNKSILG